ncbi:MAG: HlyD family secretion protein [Gemmataceae bacterium]
MNKKSVLIAAALVIVVALSLGFFWPFSHNSDVLVLPGTVEVQEIRLGSKVGGRVAKVSVREGDTVEPDTVLLQFEAPELEAQREQTEQRLAAAKADLLKAENGPRPQEKEEAREAMLSAQARNERMIKGWREEEKNQARYDLENYKSDLVLAKETWERYAKSGSTASQNEIDTARSRLTAAQARVNSAQAKYDMLMSGNREEDKADAEAEMRRTKAHWNLLEAGTRQEEKDVARAQVGELEGKLREIKANLAETVVKAPSKIVVEVLGVRKGDLVAPNTPVIRALNAEDRWVKVFVPSPELGKIHVGDPAAVTCDSYPGQQFRGTVIQIATIGEFTPRNVQSADERKHQVFAVKVRVDEDPDVFKSGMAAEVRLALKGTP